MKNSTILVVTFFTLVTTLFAITPNEAYLKAKEYEKDGNLKKALEYYKLAAKISLSKDNNDKAKISSNKVAPKPEKPKKTNPFAKWQIQPYKKNYVLLATYDKTNHLGRKRVETKFQLSFKKLLLSDLFSSGGDFYFGYTQQSYWQTTQKSSPFRETNYAPEFFLSFDNLQNSYHLNRYQIGLLHQSNGRGSTESRSWNRIYMQGFFDYKGIKIVPRVWYRIPEHAKSSPTDTSGDDNPDIWKYLGYGDLVISMPYKRHLFSLKLRDNLRASQNKGSVQFDWNFPLLINNGVYGYLQIFSGYGESLIDYNVRNNKIGIGFAILR